MTFQRLPLLLVPWLAASLDNGIARTPPLGWTSWTNAWGDPNETYLQETMDALVRPQSFAGGAPLSLHSLGYVRVGLDDGWQACGKGWNSSYHGRDGRPLVNSSRFPNVSRMTSYGHSNGLKVSWYLNNCICLEVRSDEPESWYTGDVNLLFSYGFDGTKLDACGPLHNLTHWEQLLNATVRPMLIENCHRGGDTPYYDSVKGDFWCPYHMYRTGMDIVPGSWESFMANLESSIPYLNHDPPLSRPGCWAYGDSVQTGNYLKIEQDRTHFGVWCITSTPLILGLDVTDKNRLERVWPIISNQEAIEVNQKWSGHPGRLINETRRELPIRFVHALPCDSSQKQKDWMLGPVINETSRGHSIVSTSTGLCVDAWSRILTLEPCTKNASQEFIYHKVAGTLKAPSYPNGDGKLGGCLDIVAKAGPSVQLTSCYNEPNDFFDFSDDGTWADRGTGQPYPRRCLQWEHGTAVEGQLWAKPLPEDALAVLAFNAGIGSSVSFDVDLRKLNEAFGRSTESAYAVRDVWSHADRGEVMSKMSLGPIASHDSAFYVLRKMGSSLPVLAI